MKRVAVFGNAGGGKSTLSHRLAEITRLPLYGVDVLQFKGGKYNAAEQDGGKLPVAVYRKLHSEILRQDEWIIDGFESVEMAWERFSVADTLIYIDLHLLTHYLGITTRFATGLFQNPQGWPSQSPIWESTLSSYKVVRLCHQFLTPRYRKYVAEASLAKQVYHLKSRSAMADFIQAVGDKRSVAPLNRIHG